MVSRLWTRFSDSDCERSRPRNDKKLARIPLAAWSLLFQGQQFLNNHLARAPVTPNQQGTHEMRDEVLASVRAQDMDTSRCHMSADLDDVEFYWKNDQLDVNAVFRPAIDTPFHQQRLTTWRCEFQQKTPFCSTKRRTRRTLLQPHQSLRDQHDPVNSSEVVHLEQNRKLFLIISFRNLF